MKAGGEERRDDAHVIVAIGASGGRTASLERFLRLLPPLEKASIVVVAQHREALDEARLKQAMSEHGRDLVTIEAGAEVVPGPV